MKSTNAKSFIEILADCPYCNNQNDVTEIKESLISGELRESSVNEEIKCSHCMQLFIIKDIDF